MSIKSEQYNSLKRVKQYLLDELHPKTRCKTEAERKNKIHFCLRHFPFLKEDGEPIFSVH